MQGCSLGGINQDYHVCLAVCSGKYHPAGNLIGHRLRGVCNREYQSPSFLASGIYRGRIAAGTSRLAVSKRRITLLSKCPLIIHVDELIQSGVSSARVKIGSDCAIVLTSPISNVPVSIVRWVWQTESCLAHDATSRNLARFAGIYLKVSVDLVAPT
jgi:hypothetical protein